MGIKNGIKSLCEALGKKNKATYVMVSIALVKGIFRPIFTMSDKKEPIESRKYTAMREGLTEAFAIPIYLAVDWLVGKATKKIVPENAPKIMGINARRLAETNLNLIGICIAAGIIVPAVCLFATSKLLKKPGDKQDAQKLDIQSPTDNLVKPVEVSQLPKQSFANTPYPMHKFLNSDNMRVGL